MVTPVAVTVEPVPLANRPPDPSPVAVMVVPLRFSVATPVPPVMNAPATYASVPVVDAEPPLIVITAPEPAIIALAVDGRPLPAVDTATSVALIVDPVPVAKRPKEPVPVTATDPPFNVTAPPVSACTPCANDPPVAIVVAAVAEIAPP